MMITTLLCCAEYDFDCRVKTHPSKPWSSPSGLRIAPYLRFRVSRSLLGLWSEVMSPFPIFIHYLSLGRTAFKASLFTVGLGVQGLAAPSDGVRGFGPAS